MSKQMRRTKYNANHQYTLHRWIILNMADGFAKKTGHDIEELLSIGNSVFMYCYKSWKHDKGRFSTWLCTCLRTKMIDHVRKNDKPLTTSNREAPDLTRLSDTHFEGHPRHNLYAKEMGYSLTTEAKFVIGVLLSDPCLLLNLKGTETPKHVRGALRRFLEKAGWTQEQIWSCFREIRTALKEDTI